MPEGESKFSSGIIDKVEASKVFYKIATAQGSSGAPVLDRNCMAVSVATKYSKNYLVRVLLNLKKSI